MTLRPRPFFGHVQAIKRSWTLGPKSTFMELRGSRGSFKGSLKWHRTSRKLINFATARNNNKGSGNNNNNSNSSSSCSSCNVTKAKRFFLVHWTTNGSSLISFSDKIDQHCVCCVVHWSFYFAHTHILTHRYSLTIPHTTVTPNIPHTFSIPKHTFFLKYTLSKRLFRRQAGCWMSWL